MHVRWPFLRQLNRREANFATLQKTAKAGQISRLAGTLQHSVRFLLREPHHAWKGSDSSPIMQQYSNLTGAALRLLSPQLPALSIL
jgi:hypothetical protein